MAATVAEIKARFPEQMALMEDANLRMTMGVAGIINHYEEVVLKRDELLQLRHEEILRLQQFNIDRASTVSHLEQQVAALQATLHMKLKKKKGKRK